MSILGSIYEMLISAWDYYVLGYDLTCENFHLYKSRGAVVFMHGLGIRFLGVKLEATKIIDVEAWIVKITKLRRKLENQRKNVRFVMC